MASGRSSGSGSSRGRPPRGNDALRRLARTGRRRRHRRHVRAPRRGRWPTRAGSRPSATGSAAAAPGRLVGTATGADRRPRRHRRRRPRWSRKRKVLTTSAWSSSSSSAWSVGGGYFYLQYEWGKVARRWPARRAPCRRRQRDRPVQRAHHRLGHPGREHRPGGQVVRHRRAERRASAATPSRSSTSTRSRAPPSCSRSPATPGWRCPGIPREHRARRAREDQHRLQRLGLASRSGINALTADDPEHLRDPDQPHDRGRLPGADRRGRFGRGHQHERALPGPRLQRARAAPTTTRASRSRRRGARR